MFESVKMTPQVVAGIIYRFKVLADGQYVHLKCFKPLPHPEKPVELGDCEGGKAEADQP